MNVGSTVKYIGTQSRHLKGRTGKVIKSEGSDTFRVNFGPDYPSVGVLNSSLIEIDPIDAEYTVYRKGYVLVSGNHISKVEFQDLKEFQFPNKKLLQHYLNWLTKGEELSPDHYWSNYAHNNKT